MASQYIRDLKRKYNVKVYGAVYCSSSRDYFATVQITGGRLADRRDVDINGIRIMWHHKPFTYKGYPEYVRQSIASQLKEMLDTGQLSVYEHDRDGNRRYQDHRYHDMEYLKRIINRMYGEISK